MDTRTVVRSRLRPGNVHAHSPNSGLSADRPAGGDEEPFDHLVGWDHLPAASATVSTAHLIGLPIVTRPWTVHEIEHVTFGRSPVKDGCLTL